MNRAEELIAEKGAVEAMLALWTGRSSCNYCVYNAMKLDGNCHLNPSCCKVGIRKHLEEEVDE